MRKGMPTPCYHTSAGLTQQGAAGFGRRLLSPVLSIALEYVCMVLAPCCGPCFASEAQIFLNQLYRECPVFLATTSFCLSVRFQNIDSVVKLIDKDATHATTLANSTSPRPEPNGRLPGPGFGQKVGKRN